MTFELIAWIPWRRGRSIRCHTNCVVVTRRCDAGQFLAIRSHILTPLLHPGLQPYYVFDPPQAYRKDTEHVVGPRFDWKRPQWKFATVLQRWAAPSNCSLHEMDNCKCEGCRYRSDKQIAQRR